MTTKCKTCSRSRNCINGTYCLQRSVYVEHQDMTVCTEYRPRQ